MTSYRHGSRKSGGPRLVNADAGFVVATGGETSCPTKSHIHPRNSKERRHPRSVGVTPTSRKGGHPAPRSQPPPSFQRPSLTHRLREIPQCKGRYPFHLMWLFLISLELGYRIGWASPSHRRQKPCETLPSSLPIQATLRLPSKKLVCEEFALDTPCKSFLLSLLDG
jgi:hypothetical protein